MVQIPMTGAIKSSSSSEETTDELENQAHSAVSVNQSEHSYSLQIILHKLNERNYLEWAQSAKLVSDGKGKLGHLIGEVQKPVDGDPFLNAWISENSMIIAWLVNLMEPTSGKQFLFCPTAKDV